MSALNIFPYSFNRFRFVTRTMAIIEEEWKKSTDTEPMLKRMVDRQFPDAEPCNWKHSERNTRFPKAGNRGDPASELGTNSSWSGNLPIMGFDSLRNKRCQAGWHKRHGKDGVTVVTEEQKPDFVEFPDFRDGFPRDFHGAEGGLCAKAGFCTSLGNLRGRHRRELLPR